MQSCTIEIRLKPRAKNDRVVVQADGKFDVAVTSPPLEGRANAHLVRLLADHLDLPKAAVRLIRGEHARSKVVAIDGIGAQDVMERLRAAAQGR